MSITPTNIPAGELPANWRNMDGSPEVTPTPKGASFLDPLDEGLIKNINPTLSQTLEAPKNKASDVPGTIDSLDSLNAENLGSDSFSLLRLLHKCSVEQRTGARMVQKSEALASKNAKLAAAQEIRESAFQKLLSSITSNALQIGSAGVQAYSATQSLKSISALKETAPTDLPSPKDTANAVSVTDGLNQDITAKIEPGNALIEQPLAKTVNTDTANAIASDQSKALVVHGEQNHTMVVHGEQNHAMVVHGEQNHAMVAHGEQNHAMVGADGGGAPQRNIHIDDQGTLSVRDAGGNETLRIEVIDDATEVAAVPAKAETPSTANPGDAAAEAEGTKPATDTDLAKKELEFQAARLKAVSEMTQAVGGVMSAFAQNSASVHDAQKAELEAQAATHDMAVQQAGDEIQQALEQTRGWKDMLQGIDQNNIDTNRGIFRNI